MWTYLAFKITGFTIAYLPTRVGYLLTRFVADMLYVFWPPLRAAVAANMRPVLGSEVDNATLRRAVRGVLRNATKNYFDLIHLPHMKLDNIDSRITTHGWHNFEDALSRGKGVIVVTAHLGSFDMAGQMLAARSAKVTVLVEPLEPPALLNHVIALRRSKGLTCMPTQSGVLEVVTQALQRGEAVGLVCDRDIGKDGFKATFFGKETTFPTGAVRIAMRTGAAVVPAFNLRRGDGGYDAYFEPALDVIPSG
ncbi:MAG: hypothetical protein E3J81_06300, partial [Dehalococcoidia bacterium]